MLIAIEGIDGCGKTSAIRELQALNPGWTYSAEPDIQGTLGLLAKAAIDGLSDFPPVCNLLVFQAARLAHLERIHAAEKLARGEMIVLDRYTTSTMVYQQDQWPTNQILEMIMPGAPRADLSIWIDVPPEECRRRLQGRGHSEAHLARLSTYSARYAAIFMHRHTSWSDWMHTIRSDGSRSVASIVEEMDLVIRQARDAIES